MDCDVISLHYCCNLTALNPKPVVIGLRECHVWRSNFTVFNMYYCNAGHGAFTDPRKCFCC